MAKRVAVAEARAYFKDLVQDVRRKGERVKITRYGKTLACIVPVADAKKLEECDEELEVCANKKKAAAKGA